MRRKRNKMGKFEKHIGTGEPVIINGEEFILKPLGTKFIPDFFLAMKAFSGAKEGGSTEDMLKNIDEKGLEAIRRIIEATLTKSFPEEPEEDRSAFGMRYMNTLFSHIMELNSAPATKDVGALKKAETIARLKEKQTQEKTA